MGLKNGVSVQTLDSRHNVAVKLQYTNYDGVCRYTICQFSLAAATRRLQATGLAKALAGNATEGH